MIVTMLAEAWSALIANRLRSVLTMLGMIIGVAAVILMLAIGGGVQKQVSESIAGLGSNLLGAAQRRRRLGRDAAHR